MKKHEIFEINPNLKEVHMTSDGQSFYNDNDAKMHAKTLEDKQVELVLNPTNNEELLEDVEDWETKSLTNDLGKKIVDSLLSIPADQFKNEIQGSFLNSDQPLNDIVADFSGEKLDEGIKEPLTEIKAEADGSENMLMEEIATEKDLNNIPVVFTDETQNVISETTAEETSAEEKKTKTKKGK